MKIKCPFNCRIKDEMTDTQFFEHLRLVTHDHRVVYGEYVRLLFKIHKKIESLYNEETIGPKEFEWKKRTVQELKSLLEDKSK